MSNLNRGPYIDASYQVSVQFAIKVVSEEKIPMWQVMAKAHIVFGKMS